jgi:DNA-binding LacI/PurR family transcriptional regulator
MGNAVRRLIELIEDPDQQKKTREAQAIPCELIIRDSTVIAP